nr:hypothetical protein [bacterium]
MLGFLIGIAGGLAEFFMLRALVNRLTSARDIPFWLPLAKIGVLVACLLACAFWLPQQLMWAGIGMAAALVGGGLISLIAGIIRDKRRKKNMSPDGTGDDSHT